MYFAYMMKKKRELTKRNAKAQPTRRRIRDQRPETHETNIGVGIVALASSAALVVTLVDLIHSRVRHIEEVHALPSPNPGGQVHASTCRVRGLLPRKISRKAPEPRTPTFGFIMDHSARHVEEYGLLCLRSNMVTACHCLNEYTVPQGLMELEIL